jgi:MtrB/PioB family decaheme-associated outer membrane protein
MKRKSRGLTAIAAVTLLSGGGLNMAPRALAAELAAVAAEPAAPLGVPWWTHGYIELGGRGFLNDPQRDGVAGLGGSSLAKYYEYSTIKPGAFSYDWVSAGSADGLYQIDGWANNIGYSDQDYLLYGSIAGQQYISVLWDETPHVYSTGAQTQYNGVGTNHLTLPPGLSNQMFIDAGCIPHLPGGAPTGCVNPITPANAAKVKQDILNSTHQTDLGIRRDTASVDYRWTPTDAWDIQADYSHMRRTGTQVDGVVFSPGTSGVRVDAPKPVADTTQNYGASAEYAGSWLWDKKFNLKVAYSGSTYTDDYSSYTVDNPFCPTGAVNNVCARNGSASSPTALMSLWPSNYANGMSTTMGVDLPFTSRYMGTFAYTNMRQNEQFQPFTLTPFTATGGVPTGWAGVPGIPVNSLAAIPAQSLNGSINTMLSNNVITAQITPDLKFKASYRYYNFDNGTPEFRFNDWVLADAASAKTTTNNYAPVQTLSISYTKQNAGSELNWRPTQEWNLGAAYGYERYNWVFADASATNENSGKVYTDWKPVGWITARASLLKAERRYDNYNYLANLGYWQWPTPATPPAVITSTQYSTAYRQFMFDDRNRTTAQGSLAVDLFHNFTVTPTVSLRNDNYQLDPNTEVGLQYYRTVSAGVDVAWLLGPGTRLLLSYINDRRNQQITSAGQSVAPFPPASYYTAQIVDTVNTYVAGISQTVIPDALDVTLTYTCVTAANTQPIIFANGAVPSIATGGQYPDVRSLYQRLEAGAKYTFDEAFVHQMGWTGKVIARLRYVWERNNVQNWQNDEMLTYMYSSSNVVTGLNSLGYMTWMAWNNPNYNVHLLGGSIAFAW